MPPPYNRHHIDMWQIYPAKATSDYDMQYEGSEAL